MPCRLLCVDCTISCIEIGGSLINEPAIGYQSRYVTTHNSWYICGGGATIIIGHGWNLYKLAGKKA